MSDITTTSNKPNFWDKPEGLWGMCIVLALGAGVIWFLTWFVPLIITLGLGILGVVIIWGTIAALAFTAFTDNPLRQAISLKIQVTARKLRSAVINEDPIAFLRLLQTKAHKRLEEFEAMLPGVRQSAQIVNRALRGYQEKMEKYKAEATIQQRNGDAEEEQRALSKYVNADKYFTEMLGLQNGIQSADALLAKAKKAVDRIIDDAQDEIDNEEMRLKATTQYSSVMGKLRSVFKTSSQEEELRKEAMRSAADKVSARLGEIDQFTDDFKGLLSGLNTTDQINAEMARNKLASLGQYQLDNNPSKMLVTLGLKTPQPALVIRPVTLNKVQK
jgi:hypothetical protein